MEVAIFCNSFGKSALCVLTFTPMPRTIQPKFPLSKSVTASVKMPHTFLLPIKMSLTHFICGVFSEMHSIASQTATAAKAVTVVAFSKRGVKTTQNDTAAKAPSPFKNVSSGHPIETGSFPFLSTGSCNKPRFLHTIKKITTQKTVILISPCFSFFLHIFAALIVVL